VASGCGSARGLKHLQAGDRVVVTAGDHRHLGTTDRIRVITIGDDAAGRVPAAGGRAAATLPEPPGHLPLKTP